MKVNPTIGVTFAIAVLGLLLVIVFWLYKFGGYQISNTSEHWSEFGSYIGGTLGPILAFASFIGLLISVQYQIRDRQWDQIRADSNAYRITAVQSLERAYATFMNGTDTHVPVSDRLVWLSVARLILAATSISQKIEVNSVREMYDADEEFWRRKFYEVLQPTTPDSPLNDAEYFRQGEQVLEGNLIEERSIRVIYNFTEWPEGREDPMDRVEIFSEDELAQMTAGRRGVKEYVESLRND